MKIRSDQLRRLRERNGYSVAWLADLVGISRQRVYQLENSGPTPGISPPNAKRIADALGVDIEDIAIIEETVA